MQDNPNFSGGQSSDSIDESANSQFAEGNSQSIPTVLWRFKWLVGSLMVAGVAIGYWMYNQKPTTYQSSAQLMFKSDQPLKLDAATGTVLGAMPSGGLMQALVTSDGIVDRVARNVDFKSVRSLEGLSEARLRQVARTGIQFRTVTNAKDSRERMIASINFESGDTQVCKAAVTAFTQAIEEHFEAERKSSVDEISRLINNAQGKLLPRQAKLEAEYKAFRESANLEWGTDGKPINPHREQQFLLQAQRIERQQDFRELNSNYRFAVNTKQQYTDPNTVAEIIEQVAGERTMLPLDREIERVQAAVVGDDLLLQKLQQEKALIPLQVELEQLKAQYAESHPEVKALSVQVESSLRKLSELDERILRRKEQIQSQREDIDYGALAQKAQTDRAIRFVNSYIGGLSERIKLAQSELDELNTLIVEQKKLADKLKKAEDDDASFQRRIAGVDGMLIQLEQQLSALNLVDVSGGIIVEPILATSEAYVTGPDLKKDLILFGACGFVLGALLSILIETGAKTFRSAEEIQRELRVPVLTHIPLDEGKLHKGKKVLETEISRLDPKLSVVHRPYSPASEAVRGIRTAVLFDQRHFRSKVFQITSPLPGDGKSTVAANLACSTGQSGKKTLLIDLDLRSPRLSLRFNLQAETGLTNVLNGEMAPSEAVQQTAIENLDILPCGALPANPAEALTLPELEEVFKWAREHYDVIIVDTPPLLMVSDPSAVTVYADATMLITRIRRRSKPNTIEAAAMLRASGSRLMGVVVNKIDELSGSSSYKISASGSYQSIGYGYGDKYRRRYQQEANVQDTYIVKGSQTKNRKPSSRPEADVDGQVSVNHETPLLVPDSE